MEVKAEVISANEVKSVFLEEYNSPRDGTHVEPVLEKDGPVHEAFLHTSGEPTTTCRTTIVLWCSPVEAPCQSNLAPTPKWWLMWPGRKVRSDNSWCNSTPPNARKQLKRFGIERHSKRSRGGSIQGHVGQT